MVEILPAHKWREGRHGCFVAKTGHGKTTALERTAEIGYEAGFKIIDLWDGSVFENAFFQFKSRWRDYWSKDETRSYPCEIYHPIYFCKCFPRKVPSENFHLYTIPLSDLTDIDIFRIFYAVDFGFGLGARSLFDSADKDSISQFFIDLKKHSSKHHHTDPFRDMFGTTRGLSTIGYVTHQPYYLGMISNPDFRIDGHGALDLTSILRDTKTITSFSQAHVHNFRMKMFNVLYILGGIWSRIITGKVRNPVMIICRDLWRLLPLNPFETYKKVNVEKVSEYMFEGRKYNISFWVDYQKSKQIAHAPKGQFSYTFIGRLERSEDVEDLGTFTRAIRQRIRILPRGKWYVVEPSGRGYFKQTLPPRSMHREAGMDLFRILRENRVKFESSNDVLKAKKQEYKQEAATLRSWLKEQRMKFKKKEKYDIKPLANQIKQDHPKWTQTEIGVELARLLGRDQPYTKQYVSELLKG